MKSSILTLATLLLAPALFLALTVPPASAQSRDDLNLCLCQSVLARTLCKQPGDFSYIDEYRDTATYSFTVFYANKETRFMCMVTATDVRIKGKAWQPIMRTIPLDVDAENACATAVYSVPECPQTKPLVCCGEKTKQEVSDDKAYDFWSRPIPEILEEELNRDQQAPPAPPQEQTGTPAPAN
ncbi:MAG: hypothetical protein KKB70_02495 [Proteobacteria bacterium]|nr:hypothetical protein [Pseudomonadota bacterium]MBU1611180.1 hypothetical protein [Pseudomonadota bacterium]